MPSSAGKKKKGIKMQRRQVLRPCSKGQKNDFRDAEAIDEAVQRPTMKFVATKTAEQLDLQALHRVRERLVSRQGVLTPPFGLLGRFGLLVLVFESICASQASERITHLRSRCDGDHKNALFTADMRDFHREAEYVGAAAG